MTTVRRPVPDVALFLIQRLLSIICLFKGHSWDIHQADPYVAECGRCGKADKRRSR